MSLNATPSANRVHIGFFGCRNAGKSSVVNAVTGQELCIVSDTKGTTTDPVQKAMELLPLGPVVIIDTPGYDDEGELGLLRVRRTKQVLNKIDVAVLVVDVSVVCGTLTGNFWHCLPPRAFPIVLFTTNATWQHLRRMPFGLALLPARVFTNSRKPSPALL